MTITTHTQGDGCVDDNHNTHNTHTQGGGCVHNNTHNARVHHSRHMPLTEIHDHHMPPSTVLSRRHRHHRCVLQSKPMGGCSRGVTVDAVVVMASVASGGDGIGSDGGSGGGRVSAVAVMAMASDDIHPSINICRGIHYRLPYMSHMPHRHYHHPCCYCHPDIVTIGTTPL